MPSTQTDAINPKHYQHGHIEPCDFILDQDLGYLLGNAIKYISRAGRKTADPREDLRKAIWYLQRQIFEYELATALADVEDKRAADGLAPLSVVA